jgi:hypothetical protein
MVDDCGRRCSGPRLDRPVLRHDDDALCCRTTISTFFAASLSSSSNNNRRKRSGTLMRLTSSYSPIDRHFLPSLQRDGMKPVNLQIPARPCAMIKLVPGRATRPPRQLCGSWIPNKNFKICLVVFSAVLLLSTTTVVNSNKRTRLSNDCQMRQ